MNSNKKRIILITCVSLILILFLIVVFSLDKIFTPKEEEDLSALELEETFLTVTIDDESYLQNDNETVLILVIDSFDATVNNDETKQWNSLTGISLISFNTDETTCFTYFIDPLTLMNVKELTNTGRTKQTTLNQIGLAYGLGNGNNQGCYNAIESIREYLYGYKFSQYVCVNLDTIKQLLDYIDGVTINDSESIISITSSNVKEMMNEYGMNKILCAIYQKLNQSTTYSVDDIYTFEESILDTLLTNANEYTIRKIVRVVHNYTFSTYEFNPGSYKDGKYETNIDEFKNRVKVLFYDKKN